MTETRTCRRCHETQPIERFPMFRKNGTAYRAWRCYDCRAAHVYKMAEAKRNRRISELLRWPAPGMQT